MERSYLFKQIERKSQKYFIFDCGNSISSDFVSKEKLLRIMDYLQYSAYFVSAFEFNDDPNFYKTIGAKTKMALSSFTILDNTGKPIFKPYIEKNILGKKFGFFSITGYSKLPDYYDNIHLRTLEQAISQLKKISSNFDYIFIITDYPSMETMVKKNNMKKVITIFHLDFVKEIVDTNWEYGKILSLLLDGKFFWHLAIGFDKNNRIHIIEKAVEVKEDIGTDKKLQKLIGD